MGVIAAEVLIGRSADRGVDPDEPPMPSSVTYEQARAFSKSFPAGQPRRATTATTRFRDKIVEVRA